MTEGAAASRGGRLIGYLIAIVVIFLAGFIPAFLRTRRVEQELNRTNARMSVTTDDLARVSLQKDLARLEGKLGIVLYEVDRNNFANASVAGTQFFDGLRTTLTNTSVSRVANLSDLSAILAQRDEVTADLARADQAVKQKLAGMYVRYDAALKP